jgi:hypothetical protein
MKHRKYNFVIIISLVLLGLHGHSQQRTLRFEAGYNVAMPMGNFKDLTNKTSFNGWQAALMYGITDQVSLGVQSGFQDFYQKYPRQVYHGAGTDISAVITNSIQMIPVLLKGKYLLTQSGIVQPFVALGVGGGLVQYSKYYGAFSDTHSGFSFMAQPEVGIHIPVGQTKRVGINIAAAYNYVPYKGLDANGLHHASLKAGVSIPLRQ